MGYPELDKLLPKSQLSSEFIAILNEDSPVDTHALFTLAHILSNLLEQSKSCTQGFHSGGAPLGGRPPGVTPFHRG